jgi:prepilin-type N-terminal cleavage/methylation domain-containing protein
MSNADRGFSLLELMVAMAILSIVAIYLMETFTVNNRTYVAFDQTIEAQQNMRAIGGLMERDILHSGLMVPISAGACGIDSTSGPDILYLTDHEAIAPGDDMSSYSGIRISGNPTNVASGSNSTLNFATLAIEPAPTRLAYDTDGNGTADSDFQANAGVIVSDRNNPDRGVACGRVVSVNAGSTSMVVAIASGALGTLVGSAELVAVPAIEYRVNGDVLLRNGLPLARGVEDLQIAYLFDLNEDGTIAASEIRGAAGGTAYTANALNVEFLRHIRLNVMTRTRLEDQQFNAGTFQAMENRAAISGTDGYRRRVYTTTIMPRNFVNRMETT